MSLDGQLPAKMRLLRAAAELLAKSAGAPVSTRQITQLAGVSAPTLYHHFGSKAGLIAAVVEDFYLQLDEAAFAGAKLAAGSWAGRERERIGIYIRFHYSHPFAPLVIGPLSRAPEVLDVEADFSKRVLAGGARMLEVARHDGLVPDIDPQLTIALMSGGIRQALIGALSNENRPDPEKLTNDIWRFISAALRLPASSEIKASKPAPFSQ